jgi:hypothetical protein
MRKRRSKGVKHWWPGMYEGKTADDVRREVSAGAVRVKRHGRTPDSMNPRKYRHFSNG